MQGRMPTYWCYWLKQCPTAEESILSWRHRPDLLCGVGATQATPADARVTCCFSQPVRGSRCHTMHCLRVVLMWKEALRLGQSLLQSSVQDMMLASP